MDLRISDEFRQNPDPGGYPGRGRLNPASGRWKADTAFEIRIPDRDMPRRTAALIGRIRSARAGMCKSEAKDRKDFLEKTRHRRHFSTREFQLRAEGAIQGQTFSSK